MLSSSRRTVAFSENSTFLLSAIATIYYTRSRSRNSTGVDVTTGPYIALLYQLTVVLHLETSPKLEPAQLHLRPDVINSNVYCGGGIEQHNALITADTAMDQNAFVLCTEFRISAAFQ